MVPMERLLEAWRADPREEPTVELCAMLIRAVLKATGQKLLPDQFVIDFATEATAQHPDSVEVAIACGDLYLATGLISHARTLLESAAQTAPRDLRVRERVLKLGRLRRPTQELASRSADPETLDAPTTPLDPLTEPVKPGQSSAPPSPIMLPRNPRRQLTVHGLAPAPSMRKPTVRGVASPLAGLANEGTTRDVSLGSGDTTDADAQAIGGAPDEHPRRARTAAGFGEPPPPAPVRPKSDPPTRTQVDALPPADSGVSDDGPATAATVVGPRSDDGPPTKVGPDGPPTAVHRSNRPPEDLRETTRNVVPPGAIPPPSLPIETPPGPAVDPTGSAPRPAARRAAIRKPPPRLPEPPPPSVRPPAMPRASVPPPLPRPPLGPALEDSHSEHEIPTKVTALPPLGPHGLELEPARRAPIQIEPAPISDDGDEPPTKARELAPLAPSQSLDPPTRPLLGAQDAPRPVVRPPRLPPPAPPSDPEGDTATAVKTDLGSSQEAPTLSGALTKPFSRPPPRAEPGWAEDGSFPAPGGAFDAQPALPGVARGGTFAMHMSQPPGPNPTDPALETGGRTHVLSAREALAAAQIDPRPPHAQGMPSQQPPPELVSRGQLVSPGQAAFPSSAPPAPTFGPPPSSMRPPTPNAFAADQGYGGGAFELTPGPPAPSFGPPPPSVAPGPVSLGPGPMSPDGVQAYPARPAFGANPGYGDPYAHNAPDAFASSAPDPFGPPLRQLPEALPFPRAPVGAASSRSFRLYVALGVAVVAVTSLVGYATYLVLGDSTSSAALPVASRPIPEDLERSLLAGGPADLLKADSILRGLEGSAAPEILLARVRERALTALEVNGEPAGIEGAVKAARAAGVPDADLAFAELIEALLQGKEDQALEMAKGLEADRTRDPYFALAHAAVLERRGDPLAEEKLRAAVAIEPKMRTATVRLARWLILDGDASEAAAAMGTLGADDPARKALEALAASKAWLDARQPGAKPPGEPAAITAEIPRSLHPIFSAVKLLADAEEASTKKAATGKSNAEAQAQLKRAIDEADSPALALLFGEISLARRDEVTAFAAAARALALSPRFPGAIKVLTRASVSLPKLDQLDKLLEGLPAESTLGLRAFSAYEQGRQEDLTKLAQGLTDDSDPGGVVRARLARMRGTAPVSPEAIDRLMKADPIAGDLCAVDALLDVGELEKARAIVNGWPDATSQPLRSGRTARLLRYEGKNKDASSALSAAAPSRAVLIERILLGAESDREREQTASLIDERLGTDRPFWQAYVLGKAGDEGKAKAILDAAPPPAFDSPLASRIAAALAYAQAKDTARGEPIVRVLLESFPKNPDVRRAAEALGVEDKR